MEEDEEYFSSKKKKLFLPISYVRLDTSKSSDAHTADENTSSHSENNHVPTKLDNPYNLDVGSAVQYLNTEQYGIIKWIGNLKDTKLPYAGVEMVRCNLYCTVSYLVCVCVHTYITGKSC